MCAIFTLPYWKRNSNPVFWKLNAKGFNEGDLDGHDPLGRLDSSSRYVEESFLVN